MHAPHDSDHKVSSLIQVHQNTQSCQIWSNKKMSNNSVKYEVQIKQYLHLVLDILSDSFVQFLFDKKKTPTLSVN